MRISILSALSALIMTAMAPLAWSHCEIPCGIYGDQMRIDMIAEDITTLEKSMTQIEALSKQGDKNYNQIVRWVTNKEEHANKIQAVVYQYFMNQRIKPVEDTESDAYKKYILELTTLHQILVESMKAKQTTDQAHIANLRNLLETFRKSYIGESRHEH